MSRIFCTLWRRLLTVSQICPLFYQSDQHVWDDDHKVEECIVKLKLEETVEPAQMHYATPEASIVARVDAHLTMCPSGLVPICRVCKEMTRKDKDMWMVLPPNADAVLYHISAK